ncbi:hypothetical protein AYI68_g7080 [Smittium mucronatum]|uniref:Uncharacterized protein n=1 Tax=Smittium mucronatum TaxID=133383 RepID=A0A1R0GMP0_9FUNG|nr:hypothetical protein AYI68_g7791 [Smittium mucronatum]OLY78864.1 hypothetical protein AYI68_g7080 [Smittium mucronatum]
MENTFISTNCTPFSIKDSRLRDSGKWRGGIGVPRYAAIVAWADTHIAERRTCPSGESGIAAEFEFNSRGSGGNGAIWFISGLGVLEPLVTSTTGWSSALSSISPADDSLAHAIILRCWYFTRK